MTPRLRRRGGAMTPMLRRARLACALALGLAIPASAGNEASLARLFPQQAEVFVEGDGPARLVLPAAVLTACRTDLSDLRLFDREGREIAFLVDAEGGLARGVRERARAAGRVLAVEREARRPEGEPPQDREVYELAAPPAPPEGAQWQLVVETSQPRFVREVRVERRTGEGAWETLVGSASLFRLEHATQRRALVLPPGAGDLRVTIEGHEGFYLEPAFRFESDRRFETAAKVEIALREVRRESQGGRTRIDLARPPGVRPDLLAIATATPAFARTVHVLDQRVGEEDAEAGRADLFRVAGELTAESLEIPLDPVRGSALRIEIQDGDSPPLEDLHVIAVVRAPSLAFVPPVAERGGAGPVATLRFGGGRAWRPDYDLAALSVRRGPEDERARAALLLHDPAALARASLGPIGPNPAFEAAPALAFAMRPGAPLDAALFEKERRLVVTPSAEGLARLRLSPEDLASAREDLADVRVVDAQNLQWPYLLETLAAREWVEVSIASVRKHEDGRGSSYRLALPTAPLLASGLGLDVDAPYFHRAFTLVEPASGLRDERVVARGELVRDAVRPAPVSIEFAPVRASELELRIDDGDDAPLVLWGASLRVAAADVYLAAPAGEYRLLLGQPDAEAPRYELAAVREIVLGVESGSVEAGPLAANAAYSPRARLTRGAGAQRTLEKTVLWAALAVAVVVLGGITLRIARTSSETP